MRAIRDRRGEGEEDAEGEEVEGWKGKKRMKRKRGTVGKERTGKGARSERMDAGVHCRHQSRD